MKRAAAVRDQDRKRFLLSIAVAFAVHGLIILGIELSGLIQQEEAGEFFGPVTVHLGDYTSFPEPSIEENVYTEGETLQDREETLDQPPQEERTGEVPEQTVGPQEESPREKTEEVQATASEPVYSPAQTTPAPTEEKNIFSDSDLSGTYTISMGNTLDRAKPNFRIEVAVPQWAKESREKYQVTVSFVVGPGGNVENITIDKPSGSQEIDQAVVDSVLQWKFANPTSADRIIGTVTYRTD